MAEALDTSYQKVKNILETLEDQSDEIIKFDPAKLKEFVTKVSSCKTIRKVIDSTDIDELNLMLATINTFHNGSIFKNKLNEIFKSVNSNYCMDYFKEMMSTTNEVGGNIYV